MTIRDLYRDICNKVNLLPKGTIFRLRDVCGMPVAGAIGYMFREDVKKRKFDGVRFLGNLDEVNIYEKA